MGWFDEQLRQRNAHDNEDFQDAIRGVAGAVMGKRLLKAMDDRRIALSAIEEILQFYGLKAKYEDVPGQVTSLEEQLDYQFRPYGIMRRNVILEKDWYRHAIGAMLCTRRSDGAAVALIPGTVSGYYYHDLSTGKRVRVNRKNAELLDREAVCFYAPLPQRKLTVHDLMAFIFRQLSPGDILLDVGMIALSVALGLVAPVISRILLGDSVRGEGVTALVSLGIFMLCYSASCVLTDACQTLVHSRIRIKQDIAVQSAVMNRIMSLPTAFFRDYASGDLQKRAGYIRSLCSMIMNSVVRTGITAVFSLAYLFQMISFAPTLTMPVLLTVIASVLVFAVTVLIQIRGIREQMAVSARENGIAYAMVSGIRKVKLAGAEKRMFSRWARLYAREAELQYNPKLILKVSKTVLLAVSLVGWIGIYYLAYRSQVAPADYFAFTVSYSAMLGAFAALSGAASQIAGILPTLEMARPILEAEPENADGKETVQNLRGGVELNSVSFRYRPSMSNVIENLSLKIEPGEYVAIVGETGCGKTTLLRLLLGFEKPQKGAIYYDNRDVSRVDLRSLRRNIGVVMQDGALFQGDIYSNIVITAPQLSVNDAWEAAEIAAIADDIRSMPMGMYTQVTEGTGGISGGQKQRLMIARAIAPKPKILIFDEATSALDNVTQRKISQAIDSLNCTRIVVAHRLSTIRHCDRIVVMDHGRVAEDGTYDELIAKNGIFAGLVEKQRPEASL